MKEIVFGVEYLAVVVIIALTFLEESKEAGIVFLIFYAIWFIIMVVLLLFGWIEIEFDSTGPRIMFGIFMFLAFGVWIHVLYELFRWITNKPSYIIKLKPLLGAYVIFATILNATTHRLFRQNPKEEITQPRTSPIHQSETNIHPQSIAVPIETNIPPKVTQIEEEDPNLTKITKQKDPQLERKPLELSKYFDTSFIPREEKIFAFDQQSESEFGGIADIASIMSPATSQIPIFKTSPQIQQKLFSVEEDSPTMPVVISKRRRGTRRGGRRGAGRSSRSNTPERFQLASLTPQKIRERTKKNSPESINIKYNGFLDGKLVFTKTESKYPDGRRMPVGFREPDTKELRTLKPYVDNAWNFCWELSEEYFGTYDFPSVDFSDLEFYLIWPDQKYINLPVRQMGTRLTFDLAWRIFEDRDLPKLQENMKITIIPTIGVFPAWMDSDVEVLFDPPSPHEPVEVVIEDICLHLKVTKTDLLKSINRKNRVTEDPIIASKFWPFARIELVNNESGETHIIPEDVTEESDEKDVEEFEEEDITEESEDEKAPEITLYECIVGTALEKDIETLTVRVFWERYE